MFKALFLCQFFKLPNFFGSIVMNASFSTRNDKINSLNLSEKKCTLKQFSQGIYKTLWYMIYNWVILSLYLILWWKKAIKNFVCTFDGWVGHPRLLKICFPEWIRPIYESGSAENKFWINLNFPVYRYQFYLIFLQMRTFWLILTSKRF